MKRKQLIIATDGSPGAHEALEVGLRMARGAGARATLVYVRKRPLPILGDPFYERSVSEELLQARVALADASILAADFGVEADTEILEGEPARRVLELAQARGADLIVVGSRGRGTVASTLLGSVSSALVHDADRPVLVVKHRSRSQKAA